MDGLAVLRAVQETSPETAVIVTTAFGTVETAIQAIKAGAYDYIPKPFKLDEVRIVVGRALGRKRLLQLFALDRSKGNRKRAAEWLGVTRRALCRMAARHGITIPGREDCLLSHFARAFSCVTPSAISCQEYPRFVSPRDDRELSEADPPSTAFPGAALPFALGSHFTFQSGFTPLFSDP